MKYGSMTLSIELVTPAIAKKWSALNTNNRALRSKVASRYARDMKNGDWHRKPVAICFDEHHVLGNGQHTLAAIIESGVAQELLIARNVPRKAIAFMDIGLPRSINDISKFVGEDFESRRASIARAIEYGPGDQERRGFDELLDAYNKFSESIEFVIDGSPKGPGFSAPVLAVCAKAYYTQDHGKIRRFLTVLKTGVPGGEHESAAIRLRDYCRSLRGAGGAGVRSELWSKTMSALQYFLQEKPMAKVYGIKVDCFKIEEFA